MNDKKSSGKIIKSDMPFILSLILIACIAVVIFISSVMENHVMKDAKENVDSEAGLVQDKIDKYKHDLDAEMDDKYIESVAKDKLDLVNPDEIIVHGNIND